MNLNVVNVILWIIIGIINTIKPNINKADYVIVWILLMINLVERCFRA